MRKDKTDAIGEVRAGEIKYCRLIVVDFHPLEAFAIQRGFIGSEGMVHDFGDGDGMEWCGWEDGCNNNHTNESQERR
jgi:hypothetical protein